MLVNFLTVPLIVSALAEKYLRDVKQFTLHSSLKQADYSYYWGLLEVLG